MNKFHSFAPVFLFLLFGVSEQLMTSIMEDRNSYSDYFKILALSHTGVSGQGKSLQLKKRPGFSQTSWWGGGQHRQTLSGQPGPVGGKEVVGGNNNALEDPGITSPVKEKRRERNGCRIKKQALCSERRIMTSGLLKETHVDHFNKQYCRY